MSVTFGQICNIRDPNLVTFYFYKLTHFLDWRKNSLLVVYSTNILVRLLTGNIKNCLTPKNPKMCDPILVTLPKMRPHYRQSSRKNATPSSGTSPLASYREVPSPPRPIEWEPQLNRKYGYNHDRLRSWTEGYLDVRLATSRPHEFKSDEELFWKSTLTGASIWTPGDWVGMAGRTTAKVLRWNLSCLSSKRKTTTTTTKQTNWKLWPDRRLNGAQPEPSRPRHSFYLP